MHRIASSTPTTVAPTLLRFRMPEFELIPNAGHLPYLENAPAVFAALDPFVTHTPRRALCADSVVRKGRPNGSGLSCVDGRVAPAKRTRIETRLWMVE